MADQNLNGIKVAILVTDGFEQVELQLSREPYPEYLQAPQQTSHANRS